MSNIHAPKTDYAIEAFKEGNPEPLAKLIEANELAGLVSRMNSSADLRQILADTLRGKSPRKRGRPKSRYLSVDDRLLLQRICYWCGYGIKLRQQDSEDTACHRAVRDLKGKVRERAADTVYENVWLQRAKKVTWFDELAMANSFLEGLQDSPARVEAFTKRNNWAEKNAIKLDWTSRSGSSVSE